MSKGTLDPKAAKTAAMEELSEPTRSGRYTSTKLEARLDQNMHRLDSTGHAKDQETSAFIIKTIEDIQIEIKSVEKQIKTRREEDKDRKEELAEAMGKLEVEKLEAESVWTKAHDANKKVRPSSNIKT